MDPKTKSKQKEEKLLNHKFTYTRRAAKRFLILSSTLISRLWCQKRSKKR